MNILDNLQVFFFVRRSIDAPQIQSGSGYGKIRTGSGPGLLGLQRTSDTKSMKTIKEGLQNHLEFSFNSVLIISHRSGYRALDQKLCQNRIRNTALLALDVLLMPGSGLVFWFRSSLERLTPAVIIQKEEIILNSCNGILNIFHRSGSEQHGQN